MDFLFRPLQASVFNVELLHSGKHSPTHLKKIKSIKVCKKERKGVVANARGEEKWSLEAASV